MLRAVSTICIESRALELVSAARRDAFGGFRRALLSTVPTPPSAAQTVLSESSKGSGVSGSSGGVGVGAGGGGGGGGGYSGSPPPPPPPRRSWPAAALVAALTASLGGVYFYRRKTEETNSTTTTSSKKTSEKKDERDAPIPNFGEAFPKHVQYLVVGAGTAAFAAMRAIRAARPEAQVLLVGDESALPYMRPPLSKELWREPELAARADRPDALTFRQWNGKRRPVVYEPAAFYTPVERLADSEHGGAAVARGWTVTRLDVARHTAELVAPGLPPVSVRYDKCLVATGLRPRRIPALSEAAAAGRSLALRGLRDAQKLAAALDEERVRTVAVVGGGFLATELSAALADRLRDSGRRVVQVVAEEAPMAAVLPQYLARDAARRLREAGVELLTGSELAAAALDAGGVQLRLAGGGAVHADLVVECAGAEPDAALANASGLETHAELGGLLVNAELQARADVWAAGDAACFYDVVLGRRRVEHHDHAVVSGRLAGNNMAAVTPPQHYTHQSMFWSDLGPQLGYEAIGIIDSRLPTVGIFSADSVSDAVSDALTEVSATHVADTPAPAADAIRTPDEAADADAKRYERGVVLYMRGKRVVGVLLWNLFNRMHVARQVLAQGEFEDLFEVGKLFAPHEEE